MNTDIFFPSLELANKTGYWVNELGSLCIPPKDVEKHYEGGSDCINELNTPVKNIKQALYEEYKTSYSERMVQLGGEQEQENAIVV